MTKIVLFGDPDITSDADDIYTAVMKETNVDLYVNIGDNGYSGNPVSFIKKYFPTDSDQYKKLILILGNHDNEESESAAIEKALGEYLPEQYKTKPEFDGTDQSWEDTRWLTSRVIGDIYFIGMNSQDLDIEFKRNQFNWVTKEIENAKNQRTQNKIKWIINAVHKPWFTLKSSHSPYTAVREIYSDMFKNVVNQNWHGHNHNDQAWWSMIATGTDGNAAGEQLQTLMPDGKTIDHSKPHGWTTNINGHSGHEHNKFKETATANKNVMWANDKIFSYSVVESNGDLLNTKWKDKGGTVLHEYNISQVGSITPPPPGCLPSECKDPVTKQCRSMLPNETIDAEGFCKPTIPDPEPCKQNECKDKTTGQCRPIQSNEIVDSEGFCKVKDDPDPTTKKCPKNYEFDPSLNHCIPLIEPDNTPDCGEGYTWNPVTKVCDKDDGNPDPEKPVAKLSVPATAEPKQTNVLVDASQSIADTVDITQTTNESITLEDAGKWIKKFTVPDKNNFSIGFQALAKKGGSQSVIQKSIQVSTQGPPPCLPSECKDPVTNQCRPIGANEEKDANGFCKIKTPSGGGSIDEFGTKIPFKLTGNKVPMEVGGDPAGNGQRYNCDGKFKNYIMIGYFLIGDGQEQIEMKTDGPHHGSCTKIPVCTWWENGILCADGQGVVSSEYPHPKNHPKITKPEFKKIGKMEAGKWIGYGVYAYQSGEFRTSGQLGTINPFGADGKPNNSWILATHMTDKGEITNEDGKNPEGPKRAVPPADGQVIEWEIRMHGESKGHGKPGGTDMKWCVVYEIENPNTEAPPNLDGTTTQPTECPQGKHWDSGLGKCVDDIVTPPPPTCPKGQHWDSTQNKCVDDIVNPPPPPPPEGEIIWDSNVHLKTGQAYTITDKYGDQKPDGKGVFMAASGSPYVNIEADGTFWLEADAGHGRMYIKATNFNSIMEGEINFPDSFDVVRNSTQRLRSRHQEGGSEGNNFGGFGQTIEVQEQLAEYETEPYHNVHENSIKKPLTKKIEQGKWIKFRYTCKNSPDNKKALFNTDYDYGDGQGWVNVNSGEHPTPKPYYMDEQLYMKESYAWLRINNEAKGKVGFRNVRIIKI